MPNQFPKMIYKRGRYTIVHGPAEYAEHMANGWSTDPNAATVYTLEEARAKLSYHMDEFERWNGIVKDLEGVKTDTEEPVKRKGGRPRKDQA
jgi:trehalose/maltose hydrolase-like predicted phosphorylase